MWQVCPSLLFSGPVPVCLSSWMDGLGGLRWVPGWLSGVWAAVVSGRAGRRLAHGICLYFYCVVRERSEKRWSARFPGLPAVPCGMEVLEVLGLRARAGERLVRWRANSSGGRIVFQNQRPPATRTRTEGDWAGNQQLNVSGPGLGVEDLDSTTWNPIQKNGRPGVGVGGLMGRGFSVG